MICKTWERLADDSCNFLKTALDNFLDALILTGINSHRYQTSIPYMDGLKLKPINMARREQLQSGHVMRQSGLRPLCFSYSLSGGILLCEFEFCIFLDYSIGEMG